MHEPFDLERAIILEKPFAPALHDPELSPLSEMLSSGALQEDERCLVAMLEDQALVLSLLPMVYYHTTQGTLNGKPWLVSFCLICNAGSCFMPQVADKHFHFTASGIYNGMSLLMDEETGSIWHHLTGECVYGEAEGAELPVINSLRHMTAAQALEAYPDALFVKTPLNEQGAEKANNWEHIRQDPSLQFQSARTEASVGTEDERLPRLEAGMGVIVDGEARFYSIRNLNASNNFVVDSLGDRKVLVYICPDTDDPHAFFVDTDDAEWRGNALQLANGDRIRGATLYDASGKRKVIEQPLQHFQRWYSFAFSYPEGDVYRPTL